MDVNTGTLEVITGTMFSGKSTELIRRVNRFEIAGREVQLFKPSIDNRFGLLSISSHDGLEHRVEYISHAGEIRERLDDKTQVVGIDEIQFFTDHIIEICESLANTGRTVVVSGLLKDFRDEFFPFRDGEKDLSDLIRNADDVVYLKAICTFAEDGEICGRDATRVQRYIDGQVAPYDSPTIVVGGKEAYAPRCRAHFKAYSERAIRARTLPLFPEENR